MKQVNDKKDLKYENKNKQKEQTVKRNKNVRNESCVKKFCHTGSESI